MNNDDLKRRIDEIVRAASEGNLGQLIRQLLEAHPQLTFDALGPVLADALLRRSGYQRMCGDGLIQEDDLTRWLDLVMGMIPEDLNVGSVDEEEEAQTRWISLDSSSSRRSDGEEEEDSSFIDENDQREDVHEVENNNDFDDENNDKLHDEDDDYERDSFVASDGESLSYASSSEEEEESSSSFEERRIYSSKRHRRHSGGHEGMKKRG